MEREHVTREATNRNTFSPEERTVTALVLIVLSFVGLALYIANKRLFIRPEQLVEGILYIACLLGAVSLVAHYFWTYGKKLEQSWPRIPAFIPPHRDRANVQR